MATRIIQLQKSDTLERVVAETRMANDARVERFVAHFHKDAAESGARRLAERLALALQASLLIRFGSPAVADAFCAFRLNGGWGNTFGSLPRGCDIDSVIENCAGELV